MPSNKDLTAEIRKLEADANTEGLKNDELAELLKKLREAKELEADAVSAPSHYMLWWSKDTCRKSIGRSTICSGYVQAVPYQLGSTP